MGDIKPKDSQDNVNSGVSSPCTPTEFSSNFFRQFNIAMKLKQGRTEGNRKRSSKQVNEITKADLIQAFGSVTEDQMEKAATILSRNEKT